MPSDLALRSFFNYCTAAPRRLGRVAAISAALAAGASTASAQQAPPADAAAQGDIENAKYQFEGVLSRPEYVRALPGDRFYPTMMLEKGAKVTVVGAKGDWLKIAPPEGSFSYVNCAFVKRFGDGKQGRVTAANLLVKAGSSLQPQMWITQTKLNPNDVVDIIGGDDQFFKIKPPVGAYVYIPKDAVPVPKAEAPQVAKADVPPVPAPQPDVTPQPPTIPPATGPLVSETPTPGSVSQPPEAPVPPITPPATGPTETADNTPPPSQITPPIKPLTAAEAIPALQALETQFKAATQLPLVEQPLADLTASYEQIGAAPDLTDAAKRVVEIRLATLKVRAEALEQLKLTQEHQKVADEKRIATEGERKELEGHLAQVEIQHYAAIGTLRPSSLQVARTTLYRLTDSRTGRTLAYIWGTDPKVGTLVDQFVGVKGTLQTDGRLQFKVINPSAIEPVDPAKAYTAYAADIVPPSLMPRLPQATTVTPEQ
jgi:hypothetical protein